MGESTARLVGAFIDDCPSRYCVCAAWLAGFVCEQHSDLRRGSYAVLRQSGPTTCRNHPGGKGQN